MLLCTHNFIVLFLSNFISLHLLRFRITSSAIHKERRVLNGALTCRSLFLVPGLDIHVMLNSSEKINFFWSKCRANWHWANHTLVSDRAGICANHEVLLICHLSFKATNTDVHIYEYLAVRPSVDQNDTQTISLLR